MLVAFNTDQYIQFLKWRSTTTLDTTLVDVNGGYHNNTYHAWFVWELCEDAIQDYFFTAHTVEPSFAWEQLELELELEL